MWWTMQKHTPVRFDGVVHWQGGDEKGGRGLVYDGTATTTGADAFGSYVRVAHTWSVVHTGAADGDGVATLIPVLVTACRSYVGDEGIAVFEATAATAWAATNGTLAAAPMMQFPGIVLTTGVAQTASYGMWFGPWPLPAVGLVANIDTAPTWGRRHDGPVLLTAPDRTAVVVGPVNDTLNIV